MIPAFGLRVQIPSTSELLASDERAFRTSWSVHEDYIIEDGVIKPLVNGDPIDVITVRAFAKRYLPMIRPELPFEFAKLAHSSQDAILKFVRNYGLLGYRHAFFSTLDIFKSFEFLMNTPESGKDIPTTKPPNFGEFFHPGINDGDPVSWVLSHAETVKLILDLNGALNDRQQLKVRLERLTVQGKGWPIEYRYAKRGQLYATLCQTAQDGEGDSTFGRRIIAHIINENLNGGVSRALIVDLDRRRERQNRELTLLSVFHAETLMDCIYWHLADAIIGETIKRCLFCKRFFNATTLKRMYCPPPMGYQGDSPCAQNDRAKRKRDRDREKAMGKKSTKLMKGARRDESQRSAKRQ